MCNEIQCNGKRPEPLSEEELAEQTQCVENHLGGLLDSSAKMTLRWAATVAERDKRIARVLELLTRFYLDQGREMVCKGCLRAAPRRAGILHTKTCFVGRIEAALRGEEEGDGN